MYDENKMLGLHYVGKVQGQQRPRFQIVKTKSGQVYPHTYEDDKSKDFKAVLHLLAQKALYTKRQTSFTDAVELDVRIYMAIPKSVSKKQLERIKSGEILPTKKPDVDNVLKAVMDALNGVWYLDDRQVVAVKVRKCWGEQEGLTVYAWGDINEK